MSRIGSTPIQTNNAKVTITDNASRFVGQLIDVEGSKGKLQVHLRPEVEAKEENGEIVVTTTGKSTRRGFNAYQGLYRTLIANAIEGVNSGFQKELEIIGIGYKAEKQGNNVSFNIGYNNKIIFNVPEGINVDIKDGVEITVSGIDKQLVGETAASIRRLRQPEPYKGKGIRYKGEYVKIKQGKSAGA